ATASAPGGTVFGPSVPQNFVGTPNVCLDDASLLPAGQTPGQPTAVIPSPTPVVIEPTQEGTQTPTPSPVATFAPPPTFTPAITLPPTSTPVLPATPIPTTPRPATATPVLPGAFDGPALVTAQAAD